eukprot:3232755-Rhodomonas_salina.1
MRASIDTKGLTSCSSQHEHRHQGCVLGLDHARVLHMHTMGREASRLGRSLLGPSAAGTSVNNPHSMNGVRGFRVEQGKPGRS